MQSRHSENNARSSTGALRAAALALTLSAPFASAFAVAPVQSVTPVGPVLGPGSGTSPFSCEAAFSANSTRDSATFTFNDGTVGPESLEGRLEDAYAAVRHVAAELGCESSALELAAKPGRDACTALVPGNPFSVACYVESEVGYFFVTRDLLENVTVVFNRWD